MEGRKERKKELSAGQRAVQAAQKRLGPMPTCSSSSLVSTNPPAGSSKRTERGKLHSLFQKQMVFEHRSALLLVA